MLRCRVSLSEFNRASQSISVGVVCDARDKLKVISCRARLMEESISFSTALRACQTAIDPPRIKMHKDENKILMFS